MCRSENALDPWDRKSLGALTEQQNLRVGDARPVVLSCTKYQGLVPSDDYFKGRTIYSSDISNYKVVKRDWFAYATNHLAEGAIGIQAQFDEACVSPTYTVFSCAQNVDPEFLFRLLKTEALVNKYRVHEQATVDRRGAIRYRDFAKIELELPAYPAQRRIADILDTVDEAIRRTEQLIAKLHQMQQGLVHDLLSRGINENGELRDPQRHPEEFRESALGQVPREWEVTTLGGVGTWMSGATPSKAVSAFWNGSMPWVSPKDMKSLWLDRTIDSVSPLAVGSGTRVAPAGSVLIVVRGMILARSFPVSVISRPMAFNQDVKAIVTTVMDSRFLAFWLVASSHLLLGLVTEATHGTKRIELGDLQRQALPRPPAHEQAWIVNVLLDQESRLEKECATLAKLQLVKQGVMDDLLAGRVRVTPLPEGDAA